MFSLRLILMFIAAYALMTSFAFCDDSHESDSQVWKVGQRRWTIQEEYNYSKWVETNIKSDFFIRHEIPVDCADVPYAIRWIYARIAHLPAAATSENNRLIGHWSKDWMHLPTNIKWYKDRRFRTALIAMLSSTSTRTLPSDTYPISISADSVTAGTVFLVSDEHAGVVSHIVMDGSTAHPVQTFEAGVPARVQKLHLRNFITPDPNTERISGLIKFRWPIYKGNRWYYLPVNKQAFYSREQYLPAFTEGYGDYLEAVARRIDPKVYDPNEKITKVINTITRLLNERIPVILDGNKKCHKNHCPEGSRLWEIYSTFVRDEFIAVMIEYMEGIIRKNHLDRGAILDKMAKIHLQISPGRFTTLRYIFENSQWMSSDPEATIDMRWGLDKCSLIDIHLKSARESISFIKKKYGKADPLFAERSIWVQQSIVNQMIKESEQNNCAISSYQ